jgi:hypothetical protein
MMEQGWLGSVKMPWILSMKGITATIMAAFASAMGRPRAPVGQTIAVVCPPRIVELAPSRGDKRGWTKKFVEVFQSHHQPQFNVLSSREGVR